jgi:hypothetical protein
MKEVKKKKGLFAFIKESMNKSGGCCGPGCDCGTSEPKKAKEKETKNSEKEESHRG